MAKRFDRGAFKKADSKDMALQEKEVSEVVQKSGKASEWVKIEPGANIFRIYPPHPDSKRKSFLFPKTVSWIPQIVWESDDAKYKYRNEPTAEEISEHKLKEKTKRLPVFNSRVHADTEKDLVEEYIAAAIAKWTGEIQDKKELTDKLFPILDWQKGIKPQNSWIGYFNKHKSDGIIEFGRGEITDSVKSKLNTISQREDDAGAPITLDVFSDPDEGKAVNIKYNKGHADKKLTYEVTLLFEKEWKLTDPELQKFMEAPSLESIYKDMDFGPHFEKQLEGLKIFDAEHDLQMFADNDFLDICEEINGYYPEEDEGGEATEENQKPKAETKKAATKAKAINNEGALEGLTKEELEQLVEENGIDHKIRATHKVDRIVDDLMEVATEENLDLKSMVTALKPFEKEEEKPAAKPAAAKSGKRSIADIEGEYAEE